MLQSRVEVMRCLFGHAQGLAREHAELKVKCHFGEFGGFLCLKTPTIKKKKMPPPKVRAVFPTLPPLQVLQPVWAVGHATGAAPGTLPLLQALLAAGLTVERMLLPLQAL